MPYLLPIETSSSNIEKIDVSNGNLIFDITNQRLFYDSSNLERIDLSSVVLINTENDRINYVGAKENKLYIVIENARPYIIRSGQWISLTVAKEDQYSIFFVDPINGSDDNDGLSASASLRTINAVFSKYYDVNIYYINLADGGYSVDDLNINDKSKVVIGAPGNAEIGGFINVSNVSQFEISGCGINNLNIDNHSYAKVSNNKIYSNGIKANNGSIVFVENSTVSGAIANAEDAMFRAYSGSHIILNSTTGNINDRKLYHADIGSSIHISSSSILITTYATKYSISSTGKIYFEADPTDIETKNYIDLSIVTASNKLQNNIDDVNNKVDSNASIIGDIINPDTGILTTSKKYTDAQIAKLTDTNTGVVATAKAYTDEQIEALFGIEEVL